MKGPRGAMGRRLAFAVVGIVAVSAANHSAVATSDVSLGASAAVIGLSDEEITDLRQLSIDLDISFDEAVKKYGNFGGASRAVSSFALTHPEAYSGSVLADDGTLNLFVAKAADAAALSDAAALDKDPTISVAHGRTVSVEQAVEMMSELSTVLRPALGSRYVGAAYRDESGLLEILVVRGYGSNARALLSQTPGLNDEEISSVRVLEVDAAGSTRADSTIMGGGALTNCTSAFSVSTSAGNGIATADHCPDAQQYGGLSNISFASGAAINADSSRRGDLQWHRAIGGAVAVPRFRATSTEYRDVTSVLVPSVNAPFCRFGKVTNASCDSVDVTCAEFTVDVAGSPRTYGCMTFTKNHNSEKGDSGGPWYWGNGAVGAHSGNWWNPWSHRDVFSPIYRIGTVLPGVSVMLK